MCKPSIVYDRETLLEIGKRCKNATFSLPSVDPTLPIVRPGAAWSNTATWPTGRGRRPACGRRQKRGKRAGVRVRLAKLARIPLPTLLLSNVRSLESKLDELRLRLTTDRQIRNCCVLIFTESWLHGGISDSGIALQGLTAHRSDRTAASLKTKGGGLCVFVNNRWCTNSAVVERFCSPDLEFLLLRCRPHYLPREFSVILIWAVYIPPQADAKLALATLANAISTQQSRHPEAALIIAGDFNQTDLRAVCPRFHQHVSCSTRGDNTLDHVYSNVQNGYQSIPLPPFGRSDHISLFLKPTYQQLLKRVKSTVRTVRIWPEGAESALQDCFQDTDWLMFKSAATRDSQVDIDEYASSVTGFIKKCVDDVTETKQIRTLPNQKPWMNSEVRGLLKARDAAFKSGNNEELKVARHNLKAGIRAAKRTYSTQIAAYFNDNSDPRRMWQGIQAVTDYKSQANSSPCTDASLPAELNTFFARFENTALGHPTTTALPSTSSTSNTVEPLTLATEEVRKALLRVSSRKAAGPDGIPGRALKACANELATPFRDIYNVSLAQSIVPACFKTTTIVPIPKKTNISCLNDYRPIALTPIAMKCFERLILHHIKNSLPSTLDPHQFAYRANRSTDDAVALAMHTALNHLEGTNTYVRMLFVDFSSAFNTIIPSRLVSKLYTLGISNSLCNWIMDFLTGRPQSVRMGDHISPTLTLSTGCPQGCVLSPLLFTLYTQDCFAKHSTNTIIKFADDTTVIGNITNDDEGAYREEVRLIAEWCTANNLSLNVSKTKELIVDFRRGSRVHAPLSIEGTTVERVSSFKFLGVHISEDLTWSLNTSHIIKKAQQRLHFLRRLKGVNLPQQLLCNFYRSTVESILSSCITVWYGSATAADHKALQRVVKTAQRIIAAALPPMQDLYSKRCLRKALRISSDPAHPSHSLFQPLPSGRRYRNIRARTTRLRNSFFPRAVKLVSPATPPTT